MCGGTEQLWRLVIELYRLSYKMDKLNSSDLFMRFRSKLCSK